MPSLNLQANDEPWLGTVCILLELISGGAGARRLHRAAGSAWARAPRPLHGRGARAAALHASRPSPSRAGQGGCKKRACLRHAASRERRRAAAQRRGAGLALRGVPLGENEGAGVEKKPQSKWEMGVK